MATDDGMVPDEEYIDSIYDDSKNSKNSNKIECIIKGCTNKKGEGQFVGDICQPCYKIITEGDLKQPSDNFIYKLAIENKRLKEKLQREGIIGGIIMEIIVNGFEIDVKKDDRIQSGIEYTDNGNCNWIRVYRVIHGKERLIYKQKDF